MLLKALLFIIIACVLAFVATLAIGWGLLTLAAPFALYEHVTMKLRERRQAV